MDNNFLWVWLSVSMVANFVFYYLFFRAIKRNQKLVNLAAETLFENAKLRVEIKMKERLECSEDGR